MELGKPSGLNMFEHLEVHNTGMQPAGISTDVPEIWHQLIQGPPTFWLRSVQPNSWGENMSVEHWKSGSLHVFILSLECFR